MIPVICGNMNPPQKRTHHINVPNILKPFVNGRGIPNNTENKATKHIKTYPFMFS